MQVSDYKCTEHVPPPVASPDNVEHYVHMAPEAVCPPTAAYPEAHATDETAHGEEVAI